MSDQPQTPQAPAAPPAPQILSASANVTFGPVPPTGTPTVSVITRQEAVLPNGEPANKYLWQCVVFSGQNGEPVEALQTAFGPQAQVQLLPVLVVSGDDLTAVLHGVRMWVAYFKLAAPVRIFQQSNPVDHEVVDLGPFVFAQGAAYSQQGSGLRHVGVGMGTPELFLATYLATAQKQLEDFKAAQAAEAAEAAPPPPAPAPVAPPTPQVKPAAPKKAAKKPAAPKKASPKRASAKKAAAKKPSAPKKARAKKATAKKAAAKKAAAAKPAATVSKVTQTQQPALA